jgi:hypothetical protein
MDAHLQESLDRVMGASLDELVASNPSVALRAPEVASSSEIPPDDRDSVRRWGLPLMSMNPKSVAFKPDVQDSISPERGARLVIRVPTSSRVSADLRAFVKANSRVLKVEKVS